MAHEDKQRLRDEINRLKGEQGKPEVKPNIPRPAADHSSERERRQPAERVKRGKRATISINREDVACVDRASLPPDAEFKGYEYVVVQDLVFHTDHVLFHREVFYSPSEGRSYRADLPPRGQFVNVPPPRLRTLYFQSPQSGV